MITIYLVKRNADMTEGRGPMVVDCAFTRKPDADRYVDRQAGVMGRKHEWSKEKYGDWTVEPIEVAESYSELQTVRAFELRERALAKLTPEEREVLGL